MVGESASERRIDLLDPTEGPQYCKGLTLMASVHGSAKLLQMDLPQLQAPLATYFASWVQALDLTVALADGDGVLARLIRLRKSSAFGEIDIRDTQDQRSVCRATTAYALL